MTTIHRTPLTICPRCNHPISAATNLEGVHGPEPGDITICIACENVLRFDEDLGLELLTEAEQQDLDFDVQNAIIRMQRQVRKIKAHAIASNWN